MKIDIEKTNEVAVIEIPGPHLDATNAKSFRDAVNSCLGPEARLVFDLGSVRFVDSSGLGVLLSCLRDLHEAGGELRLCRMVDSVRDLFSLVRMDRLFDIHPTREAAIGSF